MILTALGWLAVAVLLSAAASCAVQAAREKAGELWEAAGIFACAAVIMLAVLGVLGPFPAAVLAAAAAIPAAGIALLSRETPGDVLGNVAEGLGVSFAHLRGLGGWSRLRVPSLWHRPGAGSATAGPVPLEAIPQYTASRAIPSVMEDPALGPAPEPAESVPAGVPVPAQWAALAQYIATREPEDDQQLRIFSDGDAAGALAVADAYHAWADHCLNGIGLSPAYVAGVLEAGDSAAGHASVVAQVHKRFGVIYGAIKEWVAAHGPLPHKAREFLSGED